MSSANQSSYIYRLFFTVSSFRQVNHFNCQFTIYILCHTSSNTAISPLWTFTNFTIGIICEVSQVFILTNIYLHSFSRHHGPIFGRDFFVSSNPSVTRPSSILSILRAPINSDDMSDFNITSGGPFCLPEIRQLTSKSSNLPSPCYLCSFLDHSTILLDHPIGSNFDHSNIESIHNLNHQ